jgi:eukaryotic-like serine/threonine-protein kinase
MISSGSLTGFCLDGRYELTTCIHPGTVASVYRGVRLEDGAPVAVKAISVHEFGKRHDSILRFRREVQALSRIDHPNIIRIFDSGETPYGVLYFVMEWLDGKTLLELLQGEGQLSLKRIQEIFTPMCTAVGAIHEAGIVHRDLKPGNIFLMRQPDGGETVKVLDFGIAKPTIGFEGDNFEISGAGTTVGTPEYMSPEQCGDGESGPGSDIYSLGVVLYRMLAGCPPFDGPATTVMARHLSDPPPSVRIRRPQLPEAVEAVVMRALEKFPSARFSKTAEFAEAFNAAVFESEHKGDVQYRPVTPPDTHPLATRYQTLRMQAIRLEEAEKENRDEG